MSVLASAASAEKIGTQEFLASKKLIEANTIVDRFDSGQDKVRVIVNLAEPPRAAATDWDTPESVRARRNEIAACQAPVLSSLTSSEFSLRHRFEHQAGFSCEVTTEGLAKLLANPAVVSVEPVRTMYLHLAQGIPLMNASTVRATFNGQGIAIAIVDTGVDYTHLRLGGGGFPNSKVIGGYDIVNGDSDPMPSSQAHGTCCAGIAAGSWNGVATGDYIGGVAYNAKIYALKVSDTGSIYDDDIIQAWNWCLAHKDGDPANPIKVVSNSFGGGRYYSAAAAEADNPALAAAVNNLVAAGITVLASAGNDGFCDSMAAPAAFSNVISVGAVYDAAVGSFSWCVDQHTCATKHKTSGCSTGYYADDTAAADKVAVYSDSANFLTVLAPSNNVYTTDIAGSAGYSSGDYYSAFGGTSAACPYAAGAVACIQSAAFARTGNYLTPAQVKTLLTTYGDPVTDTKVAITKPRINLGQVVSNIADTLAPKPDPAEWQLEPNATGQNTITMQAKTATDISGVEYYFRCVDNNSFSSGWQDSSAYTSTGLQAGTTYTYQVRARDKSSNHNQTGYSSSKSATTTPLPPPSAPGSISYPSDSNSGRYTVSWSISAGAVSYQLERSSNGGGNWSQIVSDSNNSYQESIGNGSYRYRVKATGAGGSSGWTTGTADCIVVIGYPFVGSLKAWGYNSSGECNVPSGNSFAAIAAGGSHSLALRSDGSIVGWGNNSFGQATPPAGNNFIAVAAGGGHSLALRSDGSIVGWGGNGSGQATPPAGNNFIAVAAGGYHSLALKSDGSIVGWGGNNSGQATPPAGNNFIAVAAGGGHSLALKSDGSIVGWGGNDSGQATPPAGNNFIAVAAGGYHNLALKSDNSLIAWGRNDYGQCDVPDGNSFTAVAAGARHSVALKSDGSLAAWGYNGYGQCDVPSGDHFTAISAGAYHNLAIISIAGDFDGNSYEDLSDFAIFSSAWMSRTGEANWNPACDISKPKDSFIDWRDLAAFVEDWLVGVE